MSPHRFLPASCALLLAWCMTASAQPMKLSAVGGGLGQTLTMTITGPAGAQYLLVMSLGTGPTLLPPPHVSPLDVGFDLLDLSLAIPGFLGSLGPGSVALPLPVPVDPVLDNLNLNFQALKIVGPAFKDKSNLVRVTLDTPGQYAFTLNGLLAARAFATTTRLADGTVLVAGGGQGSITSSTGLASAERYVPSLEQFQPLPSMNAARALHRATLLLDGRVLLTGGVDAAGTPLASAEVFDPATGVFTPVGSMAAARAGHSATRLPSGKVLVAGGSSSLADATQFAISAQNTTELFDPATNAFSAGPTLSAPRTFHDACALNDGRVLISGGVTFTVILVIPVPDISSTAQVYTPNAGIGTLSGNVGILSKRAAHTSTALGDGRALLIGGGTGSIVAPTIMSNCVVYNPSTNACSNTGTLGTPRALASIAKLPDGRVIASGGAQGDIFNPTSVQSNERFDPATNLWTSTGNMLVSRSGHGAVMLDDLTLALIAGGGGPSSVALSSAEIWQP